jgi:tetratricopeptide (TPR) repeat protein
MNKFLFAVLTLCLFCCIICTTSEGAEWISYSSSKTPEGWSRNDFYDRATMIKKGSGTIEVPTKMVLYGKPSRESLIPDSYTSLVELNCPGKEYKSKDYYHSDGNWKSIASDNNMEALYESVCLNIDRSAAQPSSPDSLQNTNELIKQSALSFQKGDWNSVIDITSQALFLNPKSEIAYTNRAGAYANKGMPQEALADCNKAIAINPDYGLAYNNRGYTYELLGQIKQARSDYKIGCNLGITRACENLERTAQMVK